MSKMHQKQKTKNNNNAYFMVHRFKMPKHIQLNDHQQKTLNFPNQTRIQIEIAQKQCSSREKGLGSTIKLLNRLPNNINIYEINKNKCAAIRFPTYLEKK